MAHNHYRFMEVLTFYLLNSTPSSLINVGNAFAPRNGKVSRFFTPGLDKVSIGSVDLIEGQAFELTVIQFAKIAVGDDIE